MTNCTRRPWPALIVTVALFVTCTLGEGLSIAIAQTAETKSEALRPEVVGPLSAAQELLKDGKYQEALAKIQEAEAVPNRTAAETFTIDQMRGVAAVGAGNTALATQSIEATIASGRLNPGEKLRAMSIVTGLYYRAKNFPKTIEWGSRYFKEGGTDPQTRTYLIEAYYVTDDFADAAKELRIDMESEEKSGRTPSFERIRLLASCYIQMKDDAGYQFALEKFLAYYPKKEFWADALRRVVKSPGFADRLSLDLLRLQQATGSLDSAAQYTTMAELALQAGFPAEAKKVMEQGFASGVLGTGSDAERQKRVRDTAAKEAAEDQKTFDRNIKDANAAKDGTALLNVGFAMVSAGQIDKGLALMEQGIKKGGLKRPEDAKLHLAIAYLAAGDKTKAIDTFKTVSGADGTAELARLWLIHVQRASS
jgi:tetratricopeptide (TPR) repeat protein